VTQETTETTLAAIVGRIAYDLEQRLGPGDVAELRRMHPDSPVCPAFWRILIEHLDAQLPAAEAARTEAITRWSAAIQAMAELRGLNRPGARLGSAAAAADVSELRVIRLLRASGVALLDGLRTLAHQLATAAVAVDCADLARLVLSDGRADEQAVRERIAYDYYGALNRRDKENSK
jgi:CRISPR type I-E-associated protein CasB/Cse2